MSLHSNCRKRFSIYIAISLLIAMLSITLYKKISVSASQFPKFLIQTTSYDNNELKTTVEGMYNKRSTTFVTDNLLWLKELFNTSQKHGQWALEHEAKRIKYLNG